MHSLHLTEREMVIPFAKHDKMVSKTCHLNNNERIFLCFAPGFLAFLRNVTNTENSRIDRIQLLSHLQLCAFHVN